MSNRRLKGRLEEKFRLDLAAGKQVVAGVSGGADSMAMLHFLWKNQINVTAAHLNHCLRGAESDGDEELVRNFCRERGIPFVCRRADIARISKERGLGEEACGREERYAFFAELAGEDGVIATAHTLSDQLETMLFRLARGSGPDGLSGISESRGNIIRPLLCCTREDVEDYCRREQIPFAEDSTNRDPRYARNRIRLEAVPALKRVNPGVEAHAGRLALSLARDRDYLEGEASRLLQSAKISGGLLAEPLREAHPALLSRALAQYLAENGVQADSFLLEDGERLLKGEISRLNLPGEKWLSLHRGILSVRQNLPEAPFFWEFFLPPKPAKSALIGELAFPNEEPAVLWCVPAAEFEKNKKIYKNDLIFSLDYDTIIGNLQIRRRLPGDRLCLPGRTASRLLKKVYSEAALPAGLRRDAVIAADSLGPVWAEYYGSSSRNTAGAATARLLILLRKTRKENDNPC